MIIRILKNIFRYLSGLNTIIFVPKPDLSYSTLSTYMNCPLKYKIQNIVRAPGKDSPHLSFGVTMHNILYEIYKKEDMPGIDGAKIKKLIKIHWIPQGYASRKEEDDLKQKAEELLLQYVAHNKNTGTRVKYLEKIISGDIGGYRVSGRLDRVDELPDGQLELIDYKTGENVVSEEAAAKDLQANIYLILSNRLWPGKIKKFSFYYLADNKKVSVAYSEKKEREVTKTIKQIGEEIRSSKFEMHRGALCGWCDYFYVCPGWWRERKKYKLKDASLFRKIGEEGKMRLSYSKMSMFINCPMSYKYLYLDKRGMKPKSFFSIGTSIHNTFENFYKYDGIKKQPTLEYLYRLYDECWVSDGYKDDAEENKYYEEGKTWLKDYYNQFVDKKFIKAWDVERYFELPVGDGHVIIGFIDRIQKNPDGSYEIFDYKTDPKLRTQKEVDGDLQLALYHWAMKEMSNIDIKAQTLLFLRFNEKVTTKRTEEDVKKLLEYVNNTANLMLEKQKNIISCYRDGLKANGINADISDGMTNIDYRILARKLDGMGKKEPEKAGHIILRGKEIFPPKINKYCGGCDFLNGCPLENKIRTEYKDKVMNLEEKDEIEKELSAE